MNRKLLNGLLLVAASCASVGTFTSCKDNMDDVIAEMNVQDEALRKRIQDLETTVDNLQKAVDACHQECTDKLADLLRRMGMAEDAIKALQGKDGELDQRITNLEELVAEMNRGGMSEEEFNNNVTDIVTNILKSGQYVTEEDLKDYITAEELQDALKDLVGCTCDLTELRKQVNDLDTLVHTWLTADGQLTDNAKTIIKGLIQGELQTINTLLGNLAGLVGDSDLATWLANLNTEVNNAKTDITNIKNDITSIQGVLGNATAQDIANAIAAGNYILNNQTKLDLLLSFADGLQANIDQIWINKANIDQILIDLGVLTGTTIPEMQGEIQNIYNLLGADQLAPGQTIMDVINQNKLDTDAAISQLNDDILSLASDLLDLTQKVENNATAIAALESKVDTLFGQLNARINALITGIITQNCYNPLFGTFSLPIGVQSNMLVNYFGRSEHATYQFPNYGSNETYDNELGVLTQADMNMLLASGNFKPVTIQDGAVLYNELEQYPGQIFLGKTFVTINPNNVNFEGQTMPLVDSRDEATPLVLKMRKSNEQLTFGYTRADNGFYEADAVMPATTENIDKIALKIDDNLKSAAKDLLKDPKSRSNIFALMKGVYDQISGMLPAYGLKAGWRVNGQDYAVYSNYNIAATTFRPLSFSTLYTFSTDRRLPILDPFNQSFIELDPSKYGFHFDHIDLSGITSTLDFTLDGVELEYNGKLTVSGTVEVTTVNGVEKVPFETEVDPADVNEMLATIQEQINGMISGWDKNLHEAFEKAMKDLTAQIQDDVNKMLDDMEANINQSLKDMITDIQNEVNHNVNSYLGKFNRFIDLYNKVAKRLNRVLADPNHYMQPTMAYNAGEGVHFLSNNIKKPTVFRLAGGDAATLYPTTYNGEVLSPCYKKFIACTNVIMDGKSAQEGDATLMAALKDINNLGQMNQVFNGIQRRFALPVPTNAVKGATYEILYVGVDYHGTTSARKFYFTVK